MGAGRRPGRMVLRRAGAMIGVIVAGVLLSGSSLHALSGRPQPARRPVERRDSPKNEITNLQAESLSGQSMQVTVDYAYAGDQGVEDVFLHAAALEYYLHGEGVRSRVPGTGFPGAAVSVGSGRITLTITRVVEGDLSTSTSVRVCLISLQKRSAFLCRNFAHTKEWD